MFEFFQRIVGVLVPIFVITTMLNVGLTQKLTAILEYLKDWRFVLRMAAANFVLVPLLAVLILRWAPFEPALKAGLLVFSLCAGAPFLIKLTQAADHDLALGAATMMLLVTLTVVYVPIVLPLFLSGMTVDAWAIASSLLRLMIGPMIAGMILEAVLPRFVRAIQPWIGRIASVTLYALLAATFIGYAPRMSRIVGTGAILAAIVIVLGAFVIGYLLGGRQDHLQDVGGLGTAQRNTAAALTIATQNFSNPDVLVVVTLANALGIVLLIVIARFISRDNVMRVATA